MAGDSTAELLVKILANIDSLTAALNQGKEQTKDFTEESKGMFDELGKVIGEVFAAEKIKDYFKEGILAFANFDKSLSITMANLERLGLAQETSKEDIEAWSVALQSSTLFTKQEAVEALNKLVTMTKDFAASQQLAKLAMDISQATGLDLHQIIVGLGNAYEGNTQNLGRLLRNFPDLKKQIEDGGDAIEILNKQFGGMAEKIGEEGLAGDIKHLKDVWNEVSEGFAKANEGSIHAVTEGLKYLGMAVGYVLTAFMKLGQTIGVTLGADFNLIKAFVEEVVGYFEAYGLAITGHPIDAYHKLRDVSVKSFNEAEETVKGAMSEMKEIWTTGWTNMIPPVKKVEAAVDKLHSKAQEFIPFKATIEGFGEAFEKASTHSMTLLTAIGHIGDKMKELKSKPGETEAEFKIRVEGMKKTLEGAAQEIHKFSVKVGDMLTVGIGGGFEEIIKQAHQTTLTVGKAFEILGKSIFKAIVKGLGEGLIQEGAKYLAEAAAALLSVVGAAAAPGLAAAGASLTAAGGTMVGVAEAALADGGYVDKPTIALIGEDGPEKVTPLSKGHPMDKAGLNIGDVHMHFQDGSQVNPRAMRSAAREFISEIQSMYLRTGQRNALFS